MSFLNIVSQFESIVSEQSHFELLEQRYLPYSFGSGLLACRINEVNIMLTYDGREEIIEISITKKHAEYPNRNWTEIYSGGIGNLFENRIKMVISVMLE